MGNQSSIRKMATEETPDEISIRHTALDYAEGWYEGDVVRMGRALHSNLAKRQLKLDSETGERVFEHFTKEDMVRFTEEGGGADVPRDSLHYKIDIMEVLQEVAMVRCETARYVDFLQLAKSDGRWLIVNVLYTTIARPG